MAKAMKKMYGSRLLSFFFRILMQGRKLKEIAVITAILE
jgi:hypothetical protein